MINNRKGLLIMERINKKIGLYFFLSLIFTIFLPAGIILIIMGAKSSTLMLVSGIIMLVLGFYGAPILWIKFGEIKTNKRILQAIEIDKLYSVKELASQLSTNEQDIKQRINYLILNRYLVGYLFKNEQELILNEKKALNRTKNSCPCCGGKMVIENNMEKCEYCGYIVKDR